MSIRVVNPHKWESAKAKLCAINIFAVIYCIGGLEWEPSMGDPLIPYADGAIFFGCTSAFLIWRLGSTFRK